MFVFCAKWHALVQVTMIMNAVIERNEKNGVELDLGVYRAIVLLINALINLPEIASEVVRVPVVAQETVHEEVGIVREVNLGREARVAIARTRETVTLARVIIPTMNHLFANQRVEMKK